MGVLASLAGLNAFLRGALAQVFTTPQPYKYYRFNVSAQQPSGDGLIQYSDFYFFDANGNRALPTSAVLTAGSNGNPAEGPDKTIDYDSTTKVCSTGATLTVVYTFTNPVAVGSYQWMTANDAPVRDPYNWTFEGSKDNVTWTVLDTVTGQTASTAARFTMQPLRYTNYAVAATGIAALAYGLQQRFRASTLSALANGAAVASWTGDVGPVTITQGTAANRPTYKTSGTNGKPAVNFVASTNQWLDYTSGSLAIGQPVSAAFIINPTAASNRQLMHAGGIEYFLNLSGYNGYGSYAGNVVSVGTVSTGPQMYITSIDGANISSMYVNGVLQGSGNVGTGGVNSGSFTLGNHISDRSRPYDGDIHEVMLFNRTLYPRDRAELGQYAFEQYAIPSRIGFVNDPASIADMSFRMRASDSVSLLASGATVSNALDLSGKGNHMSSYANASSGPTWVANQINGQPVFRFSGGNQGLASSAPADRVQTIVAVAKWSNASGAQTMRGASDQGGLQYRVVNNGTQLDLVKQNITDYGNSADSYLPNTWHATIGQMDPATIGWYRVDGKRSLGAYSGGALTTGRTTILGMSGSSTSENFVGDIAELIVYDRMLTINEQAQINRYIHERYGISSQDRPTQWTENWPYSDTTNVLPPQWTIQGGGSWGMYSNALLLQSGNTAYQSENGLLDGFNPGNGSFLDMTATLVMSNQTGEMYASIAFADQVLYYSDNRFYLEVASNNNNPSLSLFSRINGVTANVGGTSPAITSLGMTVNSIVSNFKMRLQYDGVFLRGKIWPATATEPSAWALSGIPTASISGKPAIGVSNGNDTNIRSARFFQVAATSNRPQDYVLNGTFDVDLGDWYGANGSTIARDTTRKYQGVASMKVTDGGSSAGNSDAQVNVPTVTGRSYTISGWIYIPSGQSQNPQVNLSASGISYGSTVAALDTWTQSTCTFTATSANTVINAGQPNTINNATNTYYYVDSVTLTEANPPALQVWHNGDGTTTYSGSAVVDNGDGTFSISGSNVGDNGDGSFSILY